MARIKINLILFAICLMAACTWGSSNSDKYLSDRIIIKLKPVTGSSAFATLATNPQLNNLPSSLQKLNQANQAKELKFIGLQPKKYSEINSAAAKSGLDRLYEISFVSSVNIPLLVSMYQNDDNVEYAQPVYLYHLLDTIPNDPAYVSNQSNALPKVYAPKGWDLCTGNSNVVIAVLDTGVWLTQQDLTANLWSGMGYNFVNGNTNPNDDNGHGSMVAGIIGARGNNGVGMAGVCWNCKILPIKVLDASGSGTTTYIINGINYAINNGAAVINMSLGSLSNDPALEDACKTAYNSGILLVAAMGNIDSASGSSGDSIVYPAGYSSVIGVGATDQNDNLASFSIYGSGSQTTELTAPGVNIFSTVTGNSSYGTGSGTSFASPHVAGLCALMKAYHPELTNIQIRQVLHNSADDLGDVGYDKYFGYGRINIYKALSLTSSYTSSHSAKLVDIYNFPNPVAEGNNTRFSFKSDKNIKSVEIIIYSQLGRKMLTLTSGSGMAGTYITGPWNCEDDNGNKLPNGTYIYIINVTDGNDKLTTGRGKLSILN